MPDQDKPKGFFSMSNDDPRKIVIVAVVLCLVCSVLVSAAAIGLRPLQDANKRDAMRRNILQVAGLMQEGASVDELFKQIVPRAVDLRSGKFTDAVDPATYEQRVAARDPKRSDPVPPDQDIAAIKRKAHYATVYLVKDGDKGFKTVIIPVHGYGLWSTLYGYLALKPNGRDVVGLQFYDHAETPGLGGEIDNPAWRAKWPGKKLYGDDGKTKITVVKSAATEGAEAAYQIDALAGATLTSQGVDNLVRYWAGENGFGPFLKTLEQELASNG